MKYFLDKMDTLSDHYVNGLIHEVEYLKAIEHLTSDRLAYLREENDKMAKLLNSTDVVAVAK